MNHFVKRILIIGAAFLFLHSCVSKNGNSEKTSSLQTVVAGSVEPNYSEQFKTRAHVEDFRKAVQFYNEKNWDQSLHYLSLISVNDLFYQYAEMLRSKIFIERTQHLQAIENLEKMLNLKLNTRVEQEAQILLADLYLKNHQYEKARITFQKAERALRGQPELVQALLGSAEANSILGKNEQMCRSLKKIYSEFPHASVVQHWGPILTENLFLNKKNHCTWDEDLFRSRLRSLIWNGQDAKAKAELELLKMRNSFSDLSIDQLLAIFYAQTGEPFKALEILEKHYNKNKSDFDFLNFYAPIAARAGEVKKAVQAYDQAYQISPNKKIGKQALYQAAFLSYQFRDYDSAVQKFLKLLSQSPGEKIRRDVLWHLAWIKYLKKDYKEASKDFLRLSLQRNRKVQGGESFASDRLTYWLGMSYLKTDRISDAKKVFSKLSLDASYSYYSLAARDRLEKISPDLADKSTKRAVAEVGQTSLLDKYKNSSNMSAPFQAIPLPAFEGQRISSLTIPPSEEGELLNQFLQEKIEEDPESQESVVAVKENEMASSEEMDLAADAPMVHDFGDVHLENQFVLAQSLSSLGFKDWARWSFYDLERKLKKPEHLIRLIDQYERHELTHRSSFIAQVRMGQLRVAQGMSRAKRVWQGAYPQAFKSEVYKFAAEYKISPHLVWAIMRAETQYRKDAISPVGALGLMQVMPYTGYRLAHILSDKKFEPQSLLQPEVSIRYGSRYLKRLSDQFDGFVPLIAAAYNGGPHRVNAWMRNFGTLETDEFIEHIPFLETRNYVKKVVANARIYNLLYTNKSDFPELIPSQKYLAQSIPVPIPEKAIYSEEWN